MRLKWWGHGEYGKRLGSRSLALVWGYQRWRNGRNVYSRWLSLELAPLLWRWGRGDEDVFYVGPVGFAVCVRGAE